MRSVSLLPRALRILAATAVFGAAVGASAQDLALRPLLSQYCYRCHGDKTQKGGINLAATKTAEDMVRDFRLWRRVATVVKDEVMPPPKQRRQPPAAARATIAASIGAVLAAAALRDDPGRPVLRRLNRRQFDSTVRDLLKGLPFRSAHLFPKDPQGYGFDSVGDVLFASPMLIEKYFEVTQVAIDALSKQPGILAQLIPERPGAEVEETRAVEAALRPFLRQAFRRPPTDAELASRRRLVATERRRGSTFEQAVLSAFQSVLLSPHFLFRVEADQKSDAPWPLSDHELAVRLAYFLWSTMPDARLFRLADADQLSEPGVLRAETRRMLDDPRSRAIADDFGAQWLGYRTILQHAVDFRRFKGFSEGLKRDFYEESARFFDDLQRENKPITRLLDADYGFLNQRLANHYGIPGVRGRELRPVKLPDRRRGGVLGMGSILATTSFPLRTSPVLRGKWILETLLGDPPAPPPPDAGVLPADDKQKDDLTQRQRLERHRRETRCASCHAKMDPLGFALEFYDGVGRWRTENHGRPIDASSKMPDGHALDGPIALKDWLLDQRSAFVRTAAEKMMIFALGRDLALPDEKILDAVVSSTHQNENKMRAMIEAIVLSYPFRHRRNPKND